MSKAFITINLKSGLFDAQGAAVQNSLHHLGHDYVQGVSIGKFITLELDNTYSESELENRVYQMCRQLLANPVIEGFEVRLENGKGAPSRVSLKTPAPIVAADDSEPAVREPFSFDYAVYCALPSEEQLALRSQALLKHRTWILGQLNDRDADWILVVGGEVVDSGGSLESYPGEARLKELGTANNLVPWVFTRPSH